MINDLTGTSNEEGKDEELGTKTEEAPSNTEGVQAKKESAREMRTRRDRKSPLKKEGTIEQIEMEGRRQLSGELS